METETTKTNGEKKQFTMQEVLADIYARFDLITDTQIRLNTMLQGWYVKLDVYSRVVQKIASKMNIDEAEFKTLIDSCLQDLNTEHEKLKDEEIVKESPILVPNEDLN